MITFKQVLLLAVLGKKELRLLSVVIFCIILINSQPSKYQRHLTAVCAGILRLSISMGNQFSTDYLATVGPILMRPKADPHTILILIQHWKIRALWRATFANTRIADFGLFWSKYPSFFCGHFFPLLRNFWKLQGLNQKSTWFTPITPIFLQRGPKMGPKILAELSIAI